MAPPPKETCNVILQEWFRFCASELKLIYFSARTTIDIPWLSHFFWYGSHSWAVIQSTFNFELEPFFSWGCHAMIRFNQGNFVLEEWYQAWLAWLLWRILWCHVLKVIRNRQVIIFPTSRNSFISNDVVDEMMFYRNGCHRCKHVMGTCVLELWFLDMCLFTYTKYWWVFLHMKIQVLWYTHTIRYDITHPISS